MSPPEFRKPPAAAGIAFVAADPNLCSGGRFNHWRTCHISYHLCHTCLAFREPTDVRSNFGRRRQSQKFPLPACRAARARLYTAIGWHSVPPREEAIRVSLLSRLESITAARVHVEVGKAGS